MQPKMQIHWRLILALLMIGSQLWAPAAFGQASPSPFTTGYRWDGMRRLVGQISPSANGTAAPFLAIRYHYNPDGALDRTEKGILSTWQAENIDPLNWSGFTVLQTVTVSYDLAGNKIDERLTTAEGGATVQSVTQTTYDANDRPQCVAVRMNLSAIPAIGSDACALGTAGSLGPDRIIRNVYDAAGQLVQVRRAVGVVTHEQAYVTYSYTNNGNQEFVIDANGNRAKLAYDGYDRQEYWSFPSPVAPTGYNPATQATALATAGAVSTTDYEQYVNDNNGNRTQLRKRDAQIINYTYDALNRMTVKDFANNAVALASDVFYKYDLLGRQLEARFDSSSGQGIINSYDNGGRLQSSSSFGRTLTHIHDANGNRTRVTYPDSFPSSSPSTLYVQYDYDGLNRMSFVRENGAASGAGVLASYTYDNLGRRDFVNRGSGVVTTDYQYNQISQYDAAGRLSRLEQNLSGIPDDLTLDFAYNPAGQMVSRSSSNDKYTFTANTNVNRPYVRNGLNQYTSEGGSPIGYDLNGNLTSDTVHTFVYDGENRWVNTSGATTFALTYDPMGRLRQTVGSSTTQFLYDGDALVAEYDGAGNLLRRYVHGAGVDEPIAWYEGGVTDVRRFMIANHQGSIIGASTDGGVLIRANTYDAYGTPGPSPLGRFQYTGQILFPEVKIYHYKARAYTPKFGRFLQTDPVGYDDQINLYAYVANDPINNGDPDGKQILPEEIRALEQSGATAEQNKTSLAISIMLPLAVIAAAAAPEAVLPLIGIAAEAIDPGSGGARGAAVSAEARAGQLASTMGQRTQQNVTIAVTETAQGKRVVSSSEGALRPGTRAALREGEVAVRGAHGTHAEINGVNGARSAGLKPTGTAASRPICQNCANTLRGQGVDTLSPIKGAPPPPPPKPWWQFW